MLRKSMLGENFPRLFLCNLPDFYWVMFEYFHRCHGELYSHQNGHQEAKISKIYPAIKVDIKETNPIILLRLPKYRALNLLGTK